MEQPQVTSPEAVEFGDQLVVLITRAEQQGCLTLVLELIALFAQRDGANGWRCAESRLKHHASSSSASQKDLERKPESS